MLKFTGSTATEDAPGVHLTLDIVEAALEVLKHAIKKTDTLDMVGMRRIEGKVNTGYF